MKRIYRSEKDRMVCGVCAGIGEYFNIDPTLIRLAWVIVTIFPTCGFGFLAYLIAAIVVPNEGKVHHLNKDA